jgi:alkylhydroperoxidase family enzyme
MRLTRPRLAPLDDEHLDAEVRQLFGTGPVLDIFRTLAHHPKLLKRWLVFGNHVLAKSTLAARERELVILRTGWLCRAEYEWGQHVVIGRAAGLTDDEVQRIGQGPAAGWDARDRALLQAADELHADTCISDATWAALAAHHDTQQLLDLVFTIGQYTLVSMALNTLGVQPEPGLPRFPTA